MNVEQIKKAYATILHASNIKAQDLKSWLSAVSEHDPKRLIWHIERNRGIGGSEIGTLLLEAQGKTPPFGKTSQSLAAEKLFKLAPQRALPHMLRGIVLENAIKESIVNIYGGVRDYQAETTISNHNELVNGSMQGNPDFYWSYEKKRILLDIKVPINAESSNNNGGKVSDKEFSYQAQVHHYDIIGEQLGIKADKLMIAQLDAPQALLECWTNMLFKQGKEGYKSVVDQMTILLAQEAPGMQINFIEVPEKIDIDIYGTTMDIREAIPKISNDFFSYLQTGEPWIQDQVEQKPITPETRLALQRHDATLGKLRAINEYTSQRIALEQEAMSGVLAHENIDGSQLDTRYFKIATTQTLDLDSAVSTASRYAVDLSQLKKEMPRDSIKANDLDISKVVQTLGDLNLLDDCLKSPKWDENKVKDTLIAVGEDPNKFIDINYQFRKSTTKAAKQDYNLLQNLTDGVEEFLEVQQLRIQHEQEIQSQAEMDSTPEMKAG
ncbi:hypothetical protein [Neptunomonas phycophila]|uniref:hypothetical protein n=1 Tax=Neptunomonas phycophila TaxID=1572645 RepID=UPI00351199F5